MLAVVVVLLAWGIFVAGKRGIADYLSNRSYQSMLTWETSGPRQLTADSWQDAVDSLALALRLDPNHPTYLARMARLKQLRLRVAGRGFEPLGVDEQAALLREAGDLLRASLAVRPRWAGTWATFAQVKAELGELDAEFESALASAVRFAPNEAAIQFRVVSTGLGSWAKLPRSSKELTLTTLSLGLRSVGPYGSSKIVDALARNAGSLDRELVEALGTFAAEDQWAAANVQSWVGLTGALWPAWSTKMKGEVRETLVRTYNDAPHHVRGRILRELSEVGRLVDVCPFLPREGQYERFCGAPLGR